MPSFESLYKAAKMLQEKKKEKIDKRQKELEAKELADATFKPSIAPKKNLLEIEVR